MSVFTKLKLKNILLVDDDEWIRDSMTLLFEGEGCRLSSFETAEEAIKALQEKPYDIVITDYKLPGMNGLKFLKFIAANYPNTIKVLITAYGSEDVISRAKQIPVNDIIKKPFTSAIIERSLSQLVG
ncbi:MAG: response regulator [Deltaproteobacteria bacterium]|nr:response regulator [Deltaproteobacteria bacterium]